jgi:predicted oxidoreductase
MPTNPMGLSPIALGLWRAGADLAQTRLLELITSSMDAGINTFDLADIYGGYLGEAHFGAALAASGLARDKVRLISKCAVQKPCAERPGNRVKHYDNSAAYILSSVENSLRTLRTDYLDLFLVHRPDLLLDADDTASALNALLQSGKVRHVGVSNFSPSQQRLLASRLPDGLSANQIELSVLARTAFHDGTLDLCQQDRVTPMAWSPLGGGALFKGQGEEAVRVRAALAEVGDQLGGASVDQVALAWLLKHPAGIVPVLGTTDPARVRSAAQATRHVLDRQQWYRIWEAADGTPVR